jgi:two-component system phosphate regulon response regulator PhoB
MKAKILLVDDEPDAIEVLAFKIREAGFDLVCAQDGAEALASALDEHPDLVVLDVMLPEMSGLEVCKILRRNPSTAAIPVIMLTARAAEQDRVAGLELGADDYVTKPFSPRELVLRIRKLLARAKPAVETETVLRSGGLEIDPAAHAAFAGGRPLVLTAIEFKLLETLVRRRGRVQSRERLLADVWGYDRAIDTRTVDTHVARLREKLGDAARHLDTVRGVGYRFVAES